MSKEKNHKKPYAEYVPFNMELAKEICREIATSTEGIQKICDRRPDFPSRKSINVWRWEHPEFYEMYYEARRAQMDLLVEETIEIADNTANDTIVREGRDGNESYYPNMEWINRSRLRVQTRQWNATKLIPKIYGEKSETKVEHAAHESWLDVLK